MNEARTRRTGKRSGGPKTPEGKVIALANLRHGTPARREQHGGYSVTVDDARVTAMADRISAALAQDRGVPIRPIDTFVTRNLAHVQVRLEVLESHLQSGMLHSDGRPKACMDLWLELHKLALGYADRLGMNPQARRKMGMDTGNKPKSWLAAMHEDAGEADEDRA